MSDKVETKGWRSLVQEAVTKVIQDEVKRQLEIRFPDVRTERSVSHSVSPYGSSFGRSIGHYIEESFVRIMTSDPEINALVREHLKRTIMTAFEEKNT